WFTLIGASVNIVVAWVASRLLDGRQSEWSPYSIPGQLKKYRDEQLPERVDGWYRVPGRLDTNSYVLIAYFAFCMGLLWLFNALI
ncbi:MAG: sodium transporter, partial [Pseudomonadota bacterium]